MTPVEKEDLILGIGILVAGVLAIALIIGAL